MIVSHEKICYSARRITELIMAPQTVKVVNTCFRDIFLVLPNISTTEIRTLYQNISILSLRSSFTNWSLYSFEWCLKHIITREACSCVFWFYWNKQIGLLRNLRTAASKGRGSSPLIYWPTYCPQNQFLPAANDCDSSYPPQRKRIQ